MAADDKGAALLTDIAEAKGRFIESHMNPPRYVVLDAESYLHVARECKYVCATWGHRHQSHVARVLGLDIIVIRTDGLPMLQVVADPCVEAVCATHAMSDDAR